MAPDIRSFFGGRPSVAEPTPPVSQASKSKTNKRSRKVLEDSDDDMEVEKPSSKPAAKKRAPTPEGEVTTKDDYFAKGKPRRTASTMTSSKAINGTSETPKASPAKSKATPKSTRSPGSTRSTPNRRSARNGAVKQDDSVIDRSGDKLLKAEDDDAEDIFAADFKTNGRGLGDYEDNDGSSDEDIKPKKTSGGTGKHTKVKKYEDDYEPDEDVNMKGAVDEVFAIPDDDEEFKIDKPATSKKGSAGRKRKSEELDDEGEDAEVETSAKSKRAQKQTTKKSPVKKTKDEPVQNSRELQAIYDSIPLVRPPTPPADTDKPKFKFGQNHANSGPAPEEGTLDIPEGAENCLAGLSFVFTGLLRTLEREKGQQLVKQYGGKVVSAPSSKTSYVVLGSDAGPKKLETIAKNNIKTIDEYGLCELIRRLPANGGDSKAGATYAKQQEAELEKIRAAAAEIEQQERARIEKQERAAAAKSSSNTTHKQTSAVKVVQGGSDTRLWTVKYAPTDINQICGNKTQIETLQKWLRAFPKNQRQGFKLGGPTGTGTYRAVIISGPPGIGKTTAAHLIARLEGYDVVESNASDARSKKLVDTGLKGVLDTTSLLGYFAPKDQEAERSKRKLVLIMDEVDGMSAGDRGGVGALAHICKTSNIPMILICNERKLPKMKPFDYVTYNMPFRRPTTEQIRARIMTIAYREGMKLPPPVINALIEGTGADIRQVVNMLSAAKIDSQTNEKDMDFDKGKKMSKAWSKHIVLKPWDIVSKILGGGMFASASSSTLNDKIELYFNDHEFSSLMLQENYLRTQPILANNYSGKEQALKRLELADQAANSISEGDLVDRMIHGSQQQWSLMPTHAVFSFVRPASFVAGTMVGHGTQFTAWLGKNSNQQKLMRLVKEIQGHMRLRCSADRHAIRQHYLPLLWARLVKRLELEGKESVPAIIELMDSYFLTRDDFDAIMELGIGPMKEEGVQIESQAKATFTRQYNLQSHPMPFMKASDVKLGRGGPAGRKEKPDLEEAMDASDDAEVIDDAAVDDEEEKVGELDISKDKYLKAPKKKKGTTATGKGKKKADRGGEEVAEEADEDTSKTKKSKGKGKGSAKK